MQGARKRRKHRIDKLTEVSVTEAKNNLDQARHFQSPKKSQNLPRLEGGANLLQLHLALVVDGEDARRLNAHRLVGEVVLKKRI